MKYPQKLLLKVILFFAIVFITMKVSGATYYSQVTGTQNMSVLTNWNTIAGGGGASPANFTTAADIFIIQSTHNITLSAAFTLGASVNLQIAGTLNPAGQNLTVGGTTSVTVTTGVFNDATDAGVNTFTGLVTNNNSWTSTSVTTASNILFSAGFTNAAGTFNAGAASIATGQTLAATTAMTFNNGLTVNGLGNLTITGAGGVTLAGTGINYAIGGNLTLNGRLTVSTTGNFTITGTTAMANANSVFIDNENTGITTFTGLVTKSNASSAWTTTSVTTPANLVFNAGFTNTSGSFNAGGASVPTGITLTATTLMTFNNGLTIGGLGNITIAGAGGVALAGTAVNYSVPGNLTLTGLLTVSTTGNFAVTGTTSMTGAGAFLDNNNTGITTFTGLVTHNSTGAWTSSAVTTSANMVFSAGFTNTTGTFTGGAATIGAGQTITPTVAMTFAGGIACTGNLTIANGLAVTNSGSGNTIIGGNLSVGSGGLTVSTTGNFTVSGTTSLAGNFTNNNNAGITTFTGLVTKTAGTWLSTTVTTAANMVFSGGFTNTSGAFTGGAATIGAGQTITPTVAMGFAGAISSSGNLTIANGALVTNSGTGSSSIGGNLIIGSGGLTVSTTGNFSVTGTTAVNGPFTDNNNTGTTTFTGLITNASTFTTTTVTTNTRMNFNGGFTNTATGTFTVPTATCAGTLTPTTAMTFSGTGGLRSTTSVIIGAGAGITLSGAGAVPLAVADLTLSTATSVLTLAATSGAHTISGNLTLAASSQLNITTTGNFTVTGTTTNAGVITDGSNTGTTTFTGLLTNTGTFTSTAVTTNTRMVFTAGFTHTSGTFTVPTATCNGTLTPTTAMTFTGTGGLRSTGTLTIGAGAGVTLSGASTVPLAAADLNLSTATSILTLAATSGAHTITGSLSTTAGSQFNINTTGAITVTGATTNAGTIIDNENTGITTFTGLVTNSGTFNTSGITTNTRLVLTAGFTHSSGTFTVPTATCNGTLTPTAAMTFSGTGGLRSTGTLTIGAGAGVILSGAGAVPLTSVNLNLNSATSILTLAATSGAHTTTGTLTTTAGSQLNINTTGNYTVTGITTNAGILTDADNTGITTFTGAVTNTGTINTSAVTTAANLVFNGGITHTSGTFTVPIATISTTPATDITATSPISFTTGVTFTGVSGLTIAGTGGVTFAGSAAVSIPNNLVTNGPLTISTSGAFTVAGTTTNASNIIDNDNTAISTFTGLFTNSATGTFTSTAVTTSGRMIFNGGIAQNNTSASAFSAGAIDVNTTSTFSGTGPVDIANTLTVTGGAVVLTNTNTSGVSITGLLAGTGSFTQGTNGVVKIGNALVPSITTFNFTTNVNTVEYNFAGVQAIKGGTYSSLTISGGGNKTPAAAITVNATLTLNSGVIVLGANNFSFGASATAVGGSPSGTSMIQTNSTGIVYKYYDANGSFTFPVGTSSDYTPATVNITSATFGGAAGSRYVYLKSIVGKAPSQISNTFSLNRYWAVTSFNLSAISASMSYTYVSSDPDVANEPNYIGAYYNTTNWNVSGAVASQVIDFTYSGLANLTGNYTAGLSSAFVSSFYSRTGGVNSNWETPSNWSTQSVGGASCGCTPATGGVVVIGGGNNIIKTTSTALSISSLQIDNGTYLDMGTQTGLTITQFASSGTGGNGTIKLAAVAAGTATFPTVTTNDFNNSTDGTVEYNTTNAYSLPTGITSYPNLTLSGASTKTIGAAVNVTVNGNLNVTAGTLSIGTGNFTVNGTTSLTGNFTDASNTGTTTFTGLVTNTGGTFTSTLVTTAANMHFDGGFTNSSGTFTVPTATVSGTLTPTAAMNFTGVGGLVGTGTLSIGAGLGVTVSGGPLNAANVDLNTATSILTLSSGNSSISGNLTTSASSQLTVSTTGTFGVTGITTNAGIFTDNNNTAATTFTGLVTNTGSFITSTVTTAARMVFNGGFTNTSGTFTVPTATATGTLTPTAAMNFTGVGGLVGTGTLTIGAGAGVTVSGGPLVASALNLNSASSQLTLSSGASTISSTLSTSAGSQLLISTTSTFVVTGATTNNGSITDNNNTAATTFTGLFTNGTTGTFTSTAVTTVGRMIFNGGIDQNNTTASSFATGVLSVNTASGLSGTGPIDIASTLTVTGVILTNNNSSGVNVTGVLSGTGTFTQGTNGVLKLLNATAPSITTVDFSTNVNTVEYNFAGAQAIKGTTYSSLTVSGGGNKTPNAATTVNATLTLTSGVIVLGANNFSFGANATAVAGTPSGTNMIQCSSTGVVYKYFDATGSFLFPIGTATDYTPATVNLTAATFGGAAGSRYINLRSIVGKAPSQISNTVSLNRYWAATSFNLSGISANLDFTYVSTDPDLTNEPSYIGAYYNTTNWNTAGNVASRVISFSYSGLANLTGNYTAGINSAFVSTFYSRIGGVNTNWETSGNWSNASVGGPSCACTPGAGGVVVIGTGHTITKTTSTALSLSSLQIDNTGILDMGTQTGLTITVFANTGTGGNGTIKVGGPAAGTATFPTVTTNDFNSSTDGTVEYSTTNTYNLPSTITSYPNLTFSGASTKTITAGVNVTIHGNLNVNGGTLSIGTGNLIVAGTSNLTGNFTDASNTGTTTFTGLVTNNGGTFTTTNVTTAANLAFNGGFTNTAGTFTVPTATITGTITPTTAMNFTGAGGLVGTGTLTIGAGAGVTVSGGPFTVANLNLNTASSALTLSSGNSSVSGTLATVAGSQLTLSTTGTFNITGTTTNAGSITDNENTSATTFTGLVTNTGTINLSSLSTANAIFNGGITHTSGTFNVPTATISTTPANDITATSAINFSGGVTFTGTNPVVIAGAGGVTFSGSANISIPDNLVTTGPLTLSTSGSFDVAGTSSIGGNFTDSNNGASTTFNGLVTKTAGTWTSTSVLTAANMVFMAGITNTSGAFNCGAATIDAGQTITPTAAMNFAGNFVAPTDLTIADGALVTISSGNSSIGGNLSIGTGGLTLSTSSAFTVNGSTTNNGTLTDNNDMGITTFEDPFTNSASGSFYSPLVLTSGNLLFNGGIVQNNAGIGTFEVGYLGITSSSNLSGAGEIIVRGDFEINGASVNNNNTGFVQVDGTLIGNGSFIQGTNSTLKISGVTAPSITTSDFATNVNTVNYSFSGDQEIGNEIYHHLTLSGSGVKSLLAGTTVLKGNFTVIGTASLDGETNDATLEFAGTSAQSMAGSNSFNHLTINNASGVSISSGSQDITGTLTLTAGALTTNGNALTLVSTASGTGRVDGSGTGTISGTVTMQRYITGNAGYRYIGSPLSGATISELQPDIRLDGMIGSTQPTYWCNVYKYNESVTGAFGNGWTAETNVANALTLGRGYAVYIYAATTFPTTISIQGTVSRGSKSLNVTYRNNGDADQGWNLVSNPYPSTIDWDAAGWTRANIQGNTYYAWDNATQQYASYPAGGPGVNGGSRYISSTQGFMVRASAASPVLSMTEAVKVSNNTAMWRMAKENPAFLKVKLSSSQVKYTDESLIRFIEGATPERDADFDAFKIESTNAQAPYLATVSSDSAALCVNTLSEFDDDLSVPLMVKAGVAGTYKIAISATDDLPKNTCLLLEDLETGSTIDLKKAISYSFTLAASKATDKAKVRFILHISPPAINARKLNESCKKGSIIIQPFNGASSYTLSDNAGTVLRSTSGIEQNDTISDLAAGRYVIFSAKTNGAFCNFKTDTIIIEKHEPMTTTIASTKVTCKGSDNGTINVTPTGGSDNYSYKWSNGSQEQNQTNLKPGKYSVEISDGENCSEYHTVTVMLSDSAVNADFKLNKDILILSQMDSEVEFTNYSTGKYSPQYTWSFGDETDGTDNNPYHSYTNEGVYLVTLKADNNICTDSVYKIINVFASPLGVSQWKDENNFDLRFNNKTISSSFNNYQDNVQFLIYNLMGQKILEKQFTQLSNVFALDIADLVSGIYVVEVHAGKFTKKIKISLLD